VTEFEQGTVTKTGYAGYEIQAQRCSTGQREQARPSRSKDFQDGPFHGVGSVTAPRMTRGRRRGSVALPRAGRL